MAQGKVEICGVNTAKLPVLKSMNRICGFVIGLVEGIFVLWIIFAITVAISATPMGQWVETKVMESELLTFFYKNNLVSHIINDLFF